MNRTVFVDRDGVISRSVVRDGKPYAPDRLEQFEILPGVPQVIASLRAAGYRVIVATNQPDVGSGRQTQAEVESGYDERAAEGHDAVVSSLSEASQLILGGRPQTEAED